MQGVHQAGDRPVEAHGQVGIPQVQNDLSAGHHRRVEGQDHLHGGSFWPRSSRRSLRVPSMIPPTRREYKAATVDNKPRSPAKRTGLNRTPLQRRRKRPKTPDTLRKEHRVSLKPAADLRKQLDLEWQGGDKYDMLKRSGARSADPALSEYVGGIRDPYKVVLGRSTALSLGIRLRAAWEAFEKRHPGQ